MGLDNPIHLAILLMILLLVFGAKRLPEMGRSLGHGLRGFKEAINGESAASAELAPAPATRVDATRAEATRVEATPDETIAA
jgi:sec-independent protein translocase protein TatA